MEWNIVFEVDLLATYSLYLSKIHSFLSLLVLDFILGTILWLTVYQYIERQKAWKALHFKTVNVLGFGFVLSFMMTILVYCLPESYKNLSSNMVLMYFPKIAVYSWRKPLLTSYYMEEAAFNCITPLIRAPVLNISHPLVTFKKAY